MANHSLRKCFYWLIIFSLAPDFVSTAELDRTWEDPKGKRYVLPSLFPLTEKTPINVLAIDGGGVRGIIPARILQVIEKESGKPIASLFDLIVGTSTGGILALGLTTPDIEDKQLRPKYSAKDMIDLYKSKASTIFSNPAALSIFWGPAYNPKGLEETLGTYFGTMPLHFSLSDVVVTAVDMEVNNRLHLFSSRDAQKNKTCNFEKRHVALATSAAPTFFPPAKIHPLTAEDRYYHLVDGGMAANCPALIACHEAERLFGNRPINLISIGTGQALKFANYKAAASMGKIGWARAAINMLFDTQTEQSLNNAQKNLSTKPGSSFYRFQPWIEVEDMDNVTPKNLNALGEATNKMLAEKESEIKTAVRILLDVQDKRMNNKRSLSSKL